MTANDNSVNIKSTARVCGAEQRETYHHGDLGSSLIRAGLAVLEHAPPEDLSLRALARSSGVSATAVYRHFPDKDALLGAMALSALDEMAALQRAAGEEAAAAADGAEAGPQAVLKALGVAYVRFAIAHPQWFRLIWQMIPPGNMLDSPTEQAHQGMAGLQRAVAGVLPQDADGETRRATALHCWAVVHGLAMLVLDKQVTLDEAMIERVIGGTMPDGTSC